MQNKKLNTFFLEAGYDVGIKQVLELSSYNTCKSMMLNHSKIIITRIKNSNKLKNKSDRFYVHNVELQFDNKYHDYFENNEKLYRCNVYQWYIKVNDVNLFKYRIIIPLRIV